MKCSRNMVPVKLLAKIFAKSESRIVSDCKDSGVFVDVDREEVDANQLYDLLIRPAHKGQGHSQRQKLKVIANERLWFMNSIQSCNYRFLRSELTRGGMMVFHYDKDRTKLLRILVYVSTSTMKNDKVAFRINHLAKKENPPDWVACIAVPFEHTWMFKREFLFERSGGKNTYSVYLNKDDFEEWEINRGLRELLGVE